MSTVKQKYIKIQTGEIISPVTSTDSIYDSNGNSIGTSAYFYSTPTYGGESISRNTFHQISFIKEDNQGFYNNITINNEVCSSGSADVWTITQPGIYYINLTMCVSETGGGSARYRIFQEMDISNNSNGNGCVNRRYRGFDNHYLIGGVVTLNDLWCIPLNTGAKIRFYIYGQNCDYYRRYYGFYTGNSHEKGLGCKLYIVRVMNLPM